MRQAALFETRYTYGGQRARGISIFAASSAVDELAVLESKLRTYPKCRRVRRAALAEIAVLLPTFQAPHWTVLFRPPGGARRPEEELLNDLLGPVLDNQVRARPIGEEVSTVSSSAVVVDLEVDLHNEDETGYVWTWLSEARNPFLIAPERIVVVGDDDAIAMARVVDLVKHENGTIVHVEILPGIVAGYFEAVARAAVIPA